MGLFDKIKEPIFLKDSTKDEKVVEELEELAKIASGDAKKQIEQEIKKIKFGLVGEKKIEFELKNSHIPMLIIRDLYLEHDSLNAQIDYLVLTKRRHFVIECKNLYGNLTICDNGNFIRTFVQNGIMKKERIYSPVTQNRRHLELIKKMRCDEKKNFITKGLFEKCFYENYRSIVVLANYKGFLNTKYAPKDVAEQVINGDQLIDYIHKVNNEKGASDCFEKQLKELAQYFINQDKDNPTVYIEKYRKLSKASTKVNEATVERESSSVILGESALNSKQQVTNEKSNITETDSSLSSDDLLKNGTNELNVAHEEIICARCGAPMVKRIAKRGDNKGNQFWGCSRYPKCRFILDIENKAKL